MVFLQVNMIFTHLAIVLLIFHPGDNIGIVLWTPTRHIDQINPSVSGNKYSTVMHCHMRKCPNTWPETAPCVCWKPNSVTPDVSSCNSWRCILGLGKHESQVILEEYILTICNEEVPLSKLRQGMSDCKQNSESRFSFWSAHSWAVLAMHKNQIRWVVTEGLQLDWLLIGRTSHVKHSLWEHWTSLTRITGSIREMTWLLVPLL